MPGLHGHPHVPQQKNSHLAAVLQADAEMHKKRINTVLNTIHTICNKGEKIPFDRWKTVQAAKERRLAELEAAAAQAGGGSLEVRGVRLLCCCVRCPRALHSQLSYLQEHPRLPFPS